MRPCLIEPNGPDGGIANSEVPTYGGVRPTSINLFSYLADLFRVQLGRLSVISTSDDVAPLGKHVAIVVPFSPDEDMIGVNAAAVVTLVQATEALRDGSVGKFPCVTVRQLSLFGRGEKMAVAKGKQALPFPTGFGLFDLGPEPRNGVLKGISPVQSCSHTIYCAVG